MDVVLNGAELQSALIAQVAGKSRHLGFERERLVRAVRLDAAVQRQLQHLPHRVARLACQLRARPVGLARPAVDRLPVLDEGLHMLQGGPTVGCSVTTGEVAELAKDRNVPEEVAGRISLRLLPLDVVLDVGPGNVGANAIDRPRPDEVALKHDNLHSSLGREVNLRLWPLKLCARLQPRAAWRQGGSKAGWPHNGLRHKSCTTCARTSSSVGATGHAGGNAMASRCRLSCAPRSTARPQGRRW